MDDLIVQQRNALIKKALELAPRTIIKDNPRVEDERPDHVSLDKSGGAPPGMDLVNSAKMIDGVHLDVYDFFNIPLVGIKPKTLDRLQYIMGWMTHNEPTLDLGLRRVNQTIIRLGNWSTGETKLDMLYNWLRLGGDQPMKGR